MAMTGGGQTAYAGCRKKCSDVNPQLGKRRQRRWEQIRNSGIDARGSGTKSAIRESAQNIFRLCRQVDFRHFRLITILSNNLKK